VTQFAAPNGIEASADITCQQFRRVLERAMDIDGKKDDTTVTLEGFVAAGREESLGEGPVRKAFEQWKERQKRVCSARAVEGSPIRMFLFGNDLSFVVPPARSRRWHLADVVAVVVLFGVAFLRSVVSMPILSTWALLPFPLVGLAYLLRVLYRASLREHISLTMEGGKIERSVWMYRWHIAFRTDDLSIRVEEGYRSDTGRLILESRETPHYVEVQSLLAGYSLAEKRWVASCIDAWVGPRR
jgi:hypothetical protein